ncbi:MAG: hypothetical protein ABFD70_00075 [Syntrophaceae bacterium]
MALAFGCAATPKQKTVPFPVYTDSACQAAIATGSQAIADVSLENVIAKMENRPADFTRARQSLAKALTMLQPGKVNPSKPQYERIAVCFGMALEGVDRIITGRKEGDQTVEGLGWKIFDQSTSELLLVLEPRTAAAGGRKE